MKRVLTILGGFAAVLGIVIAGGFAYLVTVDVNAYKPQIIAAVKKATGRDLVIESPIRLEMSLTPGLTVKDVFLSNPAWAGTAPMVRVADFAVKVDLLALLDNRIVIDRLVLKEVTVNLKRNADGGTNWQFEPPKQGTADQESSASSVSSGQTTVSEPAEKPVIPTIRSLQMEKVQLHFTDERPGMAQTLVLNTLAAEQVTPGAPVSLTLEARYRDIDIGLSGQIGDPAAAVAGAAVPLDLVLRADETQIMLKGLVEAGGSGISGTIKAESADPVSLAGKFGVALPSLGALALEMTVRAGQGRYDVNDLRLRLGQTDLSGEISVDSGGAVPKLIAGLNAKRIDITPFLHATGTGSAPIAAPVPAQTVRSARPQAAQRRVIADTPLPFDLLASLNAELSLAAGQVTIAPMSLTDLNLQAVLQDGLLNVSPFTMTVLQGDIDISARLDGAKTPPTLSVNGAVTDLDIAAASETLTGPGFGRFALTGGKVRLETALSSAGGTMRDVAAGLNGTIDLQMQAAILQGIDVEPLLKGDLPGALNAAQKQGHTALSCLVARFDIKDGLMTDRGVVLDTSEAALSVTGRISLADETLDLMFRPAPKNPQLVSITPDIIVDGTWTDPVVKLSAQSVLKGLAGIGLMAVNPAAGLVSLTSRGDGTGENECLAVLDAKTGAAQPRPQLPDLRSILKSIPGLVPEAKGEDVSPAQQFLRGLLNR